LFDLNNSAVKPEETVMLQEAANELKQNPNNTIVIVGHICSLRSVQYNLWLSKSRAPSVKISLVDQGIDTSRLTTKGLGEADPVAANATAGSNFK